MKKIGYLIVLVSSMAHGQTNTYPSSGNVKIFATDQSWAEGITVVKPSGWGGLRLTRNDPAGGNFNGNWALGYNASTGNDFSISNNYNGTQYDGIFHISGSTRNVGIGTTGPSQKLEVGGNIRFNDKLYFGNWVLGATGQWPSNPGLIYTGGDETFGIGSLSGQISLQIDGAFRQQEAGKVNYFMDKVGIGTTDPSSILSLKGDYGLNIEPLSGGPVNFYLTSNSANNMIGVNARTKYGAWEIPDTSKPSSFLDFSTYNINNPYYGGMAFFTRSSGASGIGTEKLVILNNGNVGIGTVSPTAKLEISSFGTGNSTLLFGGVIGSKLDGYELNLVGGIPIDNSSWTNQHGGQIRLGGNLRGDADKNAIQFIQNGTERMRVNDGGNVGIGTASPDAKLAVAGQVHATEVKVSVTVPGPDYVFEKDYKLTSLEEIKNYIDQNKHLPEVPSAKEMEKNGVQLGEMNMLLLKKIEELTLYVIELKKRDEAQQQEIEALKNRK